MKTPKCRLKNPHRYQSSTPIPTTPAPLLLTPHHFFSLEQREPISRNKRPRIACWLFPADFLRPQVSRISNVHLRTFLTSSFAASGWDELMSTLCSSGTTIDGTSAMRL